MSETTQTILNLPAGTQTVLSAGLKIPVDDPSGGGTGVPKTVHLDSALFMASSVTYSGSLLGTFALNPSEFTLSGGTISLSSSGSTTTQTGLSLNGTAITTLALDPAYFAASNGTLTLLAEEPSALGTAGSLTGAMQQIVLDSGTPKLATLAQIAAEDAILTQPSVNLSTIGSQVTGQPFQVTATLANYQVPPILYYADDGGALGALPAGATVTSSSATFTHPGLATGTHTLLLEDGAGNNAVSASFTVATAPPTAATLSSVPASATTGQAISGAMVSLTPSYATAYAVLNTGGADQGARQVFTGAAVPSLTPTGSGAYEIAIYAAATGGTAVGTSSTITVAALAATSATLANVPSSATTGVPISGVTAALTPSGSGAYAVLYTGGADEGTRQAFTGTAVPAIAPASTGSYVLKLYAAATGGAALATSAAFTVTAIATAATLANVPASGTKGQVISGVTDALTPANATAYAVLYVNGADEGTRQVFTGTAVPNLTPQTGGNYLIKIYAASTGGTALATSSVIAVANPATAASLAGVPATGSVGSAITGVTLSLTPSTATAYAVLTNGGAEQGARVAVSAGTLPNLTPTATGTDTIEIFAAATGGAALTTSGNITISGAAPPKVAGSVAPILILDASASGAVTSDSALATPQTTNNGAVQGWKDSSGNSNNFAQTSAAAAGVFETASQNGLAGIKFPGNTGVLNGSSALATAIYNASQGSGAGVTVAITCKFSNTNTLPAVFLQGSSSFLHLGILSTNVAAYFATSAGSPNPFISNESPAAGTLLKMIFVLDTATATMLVAANALSYQNFTSQTATYSTALAASNQFTQISVGDGDITRGNNNANDPDTTIYEVDIWPGVASGTGGASPTGDIAAILNYLTTKWGS